MSEKRQCSEVVYDGPYSHLCSRNAVIPRDGKWFCRQHEAAHAHQRAIDDAERRVIDAAKAWAHASGWGDTRTVDSLADAVAALEKLESTKPEV